MSSKEQPEPFSIFAFRSFVLLVLALSNIRVFITLIKFQ